MKFRGRITELVNVKLFAHVISTLQKFSNTIVLQVMADKLAFVLFEKGSRGTSANNNQTQGVGGATAWCEIPVQPYFSEYNMEGISPEDNQIYMEIAADMFAGSLNTLKSSNNVTCLKLKLTKKLVPCLTLEIESQSNNSPSTCTHDIPVNVISRKNWPDYQCPEPPTFNISFAMPELKHLRLTIERMKNIAPKVTFKMGKEGKLVISVATYSVQSTVTYSDLQIYNLGDEEVRSQQPQPAILLGSEEHYSIEVDMKSIIHLFPSEGAKPTSIICSMSDSRLLHWLIYFGEIQIQYFVPGSVAV